MFIRLRRGKIILVTVLIVNYISSYVVPEVRSLVMAFSKIYRHRLTLNDEG